MKKLFSVLIIGLLMVSAFAFADGHIEGGYTMLISQEDIDVVFVDVEDETLIIDVELPENWKMTEVQVQAWVDPLSMDEPPNGPKNMNKLNKHGSPKPGKFDVKYEADEDMMLTFDDVDNEDTLPFDIYVFEETMFEIPLSEFFGETIPESFYFAVHADLIKFDPAEMISEDPEVYDMEFLEYHGGWVMHPDYPDAEPEAIQNTFEFDGSNWAVYTMYPPVLPDLD